MSVKVTRLAKGLTAMQRAAAVMTRPVWPMPVATASSFEAPRSCCSLMRAITSTA